MLLFIGRVCLKISLFSIERSIKYSKFKLTENIF